MSNHKNKFLGRAKLSFGILLMMAFGFLFSVQSVILAADEVKIEVSKDSAANSIGSNVQAGSSGDFNILKINNTSAFPITVTSIKVTRSGGTDEDFNSVSLYYVSPLGSRSQLGSTQYMISSGVAYFDTALSIAANSSSSVAISASVASTAKAGDVVTWGLTPADDVRISVVGSSIQATVSGAGVGVSRTILSNARDTTPPAAPSNVKVESIGSVPTLKVSWDDPTDTDLDKINVYRSTVQNQLGVVVFSSNRGVGTVAIKTYSDTGVVAGTTYYYTVKALDFVSNESTSTTQYSGTVLAKGLTISLDTSSPAAGNITASTSGVTLAVYKFYASNVDAEISSLKIDGVADASGKKNFDQIGRLSLYVDGNLVASTTGPTFNFYYNDYTKLTILANTSKLLSFKTDIASTSVNGSAITLKISSLNVQEPSWYPVTVYGSTITGNKMTIAGGVTAATPAPTTTPTPSTSPTPTSSASTAGIPEGALIRAIGDFDVYIVKYVGAKKFKRLVLSPSVFDNYGHLKWSDIRDIDSSIVNAFTTSELVRAVGDDKVYKLYPAGDEGQKRWIASAAAFSRMGFDADSIYEINSFDRDSYVTGASLE